jgi:dipeptidyl aminopeptidase/acylaminoacyl peptidase
MKNDKQRVKHKPTIKEMLTYPYLGYSTINSSGDKVAFLEAPLNLKENRWEPHCVIYDLKTEKARKLTKEYCSSNLRWIKDETLATIRFDSSDNDRQIYVYEELFGEPTRITHHSSSINSFEIFQSGFIFMSSKPKENEHIGSFTHVEEEFGSSELYYVNMELAKKNIEDEINFFEEEERFTPSSQFEITRIFQNKFHIESYVVSPQNDSIYLNCRDKADLHFENEKYHYRIELNVDEALAKINDYKLKNQKIDDFSFIGKVTKIALPPDSVILAASPSGEKILFKHKERYKEDQAQSDLWLLDITKSDNILVDEVKVKELLFCLTSKFDQEPLEIRWSKSGIYITYFNESRCELARFEENGEFEKLNIQNLSVKAFYDFNDNGDCCFNGYSADTFEEIYYGKKIEDDLIIERITDINEKYSHWDCGQVESIRWKSKDGTEIEGTLRKPSDFDPNKKYPLLLFIHGGPAATTPLALVYGSDRNFHPTIQLCNRGIIILSPNYRGSLGRGQWFKELNYDNLGVGDLWDIESGIDCLIEQGFIDETRIGSMGSSQGGYISAFAAMHSDRFRAVSVGSCAASWYTYYITSDNRDSILLAGEPFSEEREESIRRTAPISGVKNTKTPMLLQHGANDQRTGIASANELFRALKQKGVHTEFFMFNDAGHGYNHPRNFYALMLQNYRWFCHYLLDEELDFLKDDL